MAARQQARLGAVQQTLFITLAARAAQSQRKLRTAIIDCWVRGFLAAHPGGTVVELGTGLNTRFERVDNGRVHWLDLDLPDTIDLRRKFFADTGRRRMVAASVLDEGWLPEAARSPGPYFFVAEVVLVYLPRDHVLATPARIAQRFPGALLALDTYPGRTFEQQHRLAARKGMDARWAWACDDPRSLERSGLEVRQVDGPHLVPSQLPGSRWPGRYGAGTRGGLSPGSD